MGDLIPFRRRKKTWTKPEDYGRVLPTAAWQGEPRRTSTWHQAWRSVRAWILLIALVTLWFVYREAGAFHPPRFLEGKAIAVSGDFTRCGPDRGAFCVVDGDTFKLGDRTIRLVGLDAPEVRARCPAEAAAAERATEALRRWLNAAPFELAARLDAPTDEYGRALMTARRGEATAAEALIAQRVARPYAGEARQSWC